MELTIKRIRTKYTVDGELATMVDYETVDGTVIENGMGYMFKGEITEKDIDDKMLDILTKKKANKEKSGKDYSKLLNKKYKLD